MKNINQSTYNKSDEKMKLTITAVSVDGLEETESNPNIDGEDVEVATEPAVEQRSGEGSGAKDEDFSGVSVLGGQTERSRVLVVDLVNVLVERTPVKSLMSYRRCSSLSSELWW